MRKHPRALGTCMVAAAGLPLHAISAAGQQPSMKSCLVGTWIVASWEQKKNDGTTLRQFGENPAGMAIFDASGRYIITVMRPDRAKYNSNALWQGTAGQSTSALPPEPYVNLFCYRESIVDLDAEISNGTLDLGVPEEELHGSQVTGSPVDQRCLGPAKRMRPE